MYSMATDKLPASTYGPRNCNCRSTADFTSTKLMPRNVVPFQVLSWSSAGVEVAPYRDNDGPFYARCATTTSISRDSVPPCRGHPPARRCLFTIHNIIRIFLAFTSREILVLLSLSGTNLLRCACVVPWPDRYRCMSPRVHLPC